MISYMFFYCLRKLDVDMNELCNAVQIKCNRLFKRLYIKSALFYLDLFLLQHVF